MYVYVHQDAWYTLQAGDIENDVPSAKRLRIASSDVLPDLANSEELSIYGSMSNKTDSTQVT